jgi:hypothetical protein
MPRDEIPREEWPAFFLGFVTTHGGHVCSLDVVSRDRSRHIRFDPMLLLAVGPDGEGDPRVRVLVTDLSGEPIGYSIVEPRHVLHSRTAEGLNETLEIEAADTKTTMRFQPSC